MRPRNRRPTPPGELLKEFYMDPRDITIGALAEAIHITRKHMSNIVNGHARINAITAYRLGKALCTTPELWTTAQNAIDLFDAAREAEAERWAPVEVFPAKRAAG